MGWEAVRSRTQLPSMINGQLPQCPKFSRLPRFFSFLLNVPAGRGQHARFGRIFTYTNLADWNTPILGSKTAAIFWLPWIQTQLWTSLLSFAMYQEPGLLQQDDPNVKVFWRMMGSWIHGFMLLFLKNTGMFFFFVDVLNGSLCKWWFFITGGDAETSPVK